MYYGTIFFPHWVVDEQQKTVCFQNDHLSLMEEYRSAGPVYSTEVVDEFATITDMFDRGENNENVINCSAQELPPDFPAALR
ncbi:TPA: phenolic acid decarboxylase [Enterobacter kobei]|nr:phenolic acid decarboxylase [Enterobacter kobei]